MTGVLVWAVIPIGAETLASDRRVRGGVADRVRRPGRAALDAVVANWTIGSQNDA